VTPSVEIICKPKTMGKRKELSLKEKVQLIKQSDGKSQRQLAEHFGVGKTLKNNLNANGYFSALNLCT
jgi:hypothetical protein